MDKPTPNFVGPRGKAYRLDLATARKTPDHDASIFSYLVNCPEAHPFWQWWLVTLIHLRPIEGVKPAYKRYPEAEHELIVAAIDPEKCPNPDPNNVEKGYPYLQPFDVVHQFHARGDRNAIRIAELCIQACVDGRLSPDQDFRAFWADMIDSTADHLRRGLHPEA